MSKVYFVGAGPGDPDLITVKGRNLVMRADLVLYAGSLVPRALVEMARPDAHVADSSPLDLHSTHALLCQCVRGGGTAVRLHTGDPSIYGAVREQIELLDQDGIAWEIVPGVTAAFAAAAEAGCSFTVPGHTQTLIVTRLSGRTPVPESESLRSLARHNTAMAIYLSASDTRTLQNELLCGGMAPDTPCVMGHRVGWPGSELARCPLSELAETAREKGFYRQTVFLVLPGENMEGARSKLYDATFGHMCREAKED
ncbi:MAG: precorrin-4 C(11)-methyltransferase [Desulfovibrionaceae bacterium]